MVRGRKATARTATWLGRAALQLPDLRGGYRRHRQTKNIWNYIMIAFTVKKTVISNFVLKNAEILKMVIRVGKVGSTDFSLKYSEEYCLLHKFNFSLTDLFF